MKNIIMYGIVRGQNCINGYATQLRNKMSKEDGVTAIEYAVIAVAISAMLLTVFGAKDGTFIKTITEQFTRMSKNITDAVGT